ncbi:uncharacterized protein LOC106668153 [Cimex lectularius]|uniref:Uncharacterized protein n=1 Tax=Cimex lectularius TaxID=79782 RepID=A0A8I6RY42_CIMLE|nr:uncharacterized protein LOC106668153 [Cimex lectularius]
MEFYDYFTDLGEIIIPEILDSSEINNTVIENLREMKGKFMVGFMIEVALNPTLVVQEPSDVEQVMTQDEIRKVYALNFFKNRKLKYKQLIHSLAEEQTDGMKNLKDKFLNDLNSLSSTRDMDTDEEAYQALKNHLTMVQKRLISIEKRNEAVQLEFEKKLARLKYVDKKNTELEKLYLNPVIEAHNKLKGGESLNDEETMQVIYAKWKGLNVRLRRTLKKVHQHYLNLFCKRNLAFSFLVKQVGNRERCIFLNTTANPEEGWASTQPVSPESSDSDLFETSESCFPHTLAAIGNNVVDMSRIHYQIDRMKRITKNLVH